MHQITLLLGCFFRQDMTVEGMLPLDFSGAGQLETLLGRRIGFNFWHYREPASCENLRKQAANIRKIAITGSESNKTTDLYLPNGCFYWNVEN